MLKGGLQEERMSLLKYVFFLPIALFGLDRVPWFCTIWEFAFTPTYTYSRYPKVQHGVPHLQNPSNDQLLSLNLDVSPATNWQLATEVEFADTPRQAMGLRSIAFQARYLLLDDILGDPVSLTTGLVVRGVSEHSLKDVSCPYHSDINFEINTAIGREWDHGFEWKVRVFGGASAGMANRGFPWMTGFAMIEGQVHQTNRIGLFLDAAAGFGGRRDVFINHFHGYADIGHRNLDIGVKYTYVFDIWGHFSVSYARRIYARSFPEQVNFFTVSYMLPFSLF